MPGALEVTFGRRVVAESSGQIPILVSWDGRAPTPQTPSTAGPDRRVF